MKYTIVFITLTLLLTACSRSDVKTSYQIAGVWQVGTGRVTFNSDGTFSTVKHDSSGTNIFSGTWQVQSGFLDMVLTNVSGPNPKAQVGETNRLQIVSSDAYHITWKMGGQTVTWGR